MKPAHLTLIGLALLLALGLWSGRKPSPVAYKDPLDTNEFPIRFTDPIQFPAAPAVHKPPHTAPEPPPRPALREPWQAAAVNDGMLWLLTEGFKHYSSTPFTGIVRFHPHELPTNFVPSVPGFRFEPFPYPNYSTIMKPDQVNLRVVMNAAWTDIGSVTNALSRGFPGMQVATFTLALVGHAGIGTVDLYATFGVYKDTNGYSTKVLHWFDP